MKSNAVPKTVDKYIALYPSDVQPILRKIRETIRKAAPEAEESISYKMPAFRMPQGIVLYFAAYKHHIGLYPAPRTAVELKDELAAYAGGKGTLKLPLDQPIPYRLIAKIVKYRTKLILAKAAAKRKTR